MWFIFSLIALLAWAGSDLFSKWGTRPDDRYSHLRLVIMVGFVMGVHAVGYMLIGHIEYDPMCMIRYLPISALYILSMTIGYIGLRYLMLSLSSPVCNSSGALVALLCFFVLGDDLIPLQWVAVACICVGMVLLGIVERRQELAAIPAGEDTKKYQNTALALLLPIGYCILDALGTFADAFVLDGETPIFTEAEAEISYELTFLVCAVLALCYLLFIRKEKFSVVKERKFLFGALCETLGQFFYVYAMAAKPVAAAPMIASYCVVSVLFSRIFLKEKLTKKQYAVIALVIAGIVLLGICEGLAEA